MAKIDEYQDVLDVRDIIVRVEELEGDEHEARDDMTDDERVEYDALNALLADLKGNGGDEQWRGDWYPVTLIRDSYFEDYAQELAEDIGAIKDDAQWPANCIDWERAARELQQDYSSVEYNEVTYWYR